MFDHQVSGLPVVDEENKVIASISASDLKASTEKTLIFDVHTPLREYLSNCNRLFKKDPNSKPITCTIKSTLCEVIAKLVKNHIHRIFVVDDNNTLIGVLSLCDVITAIRNQ